MKTSLLFTCVALSVVFSLPVRADDAAPAGIVVITPATRLRDPFWPVSYVPSNPVPAPVISFAVNSTGTTADTLPPSPKEPQWDAARKLLKVQGISRVGIDKKTGHPTFFAVINGRVVEEGSIVDAATPDFKYRWKVASIAEKNIKLNPLEAQSR
jgi:hypothetical protein